MCQHDNVLITPQSVYAFCIVNGSTILRSHNNHQTWCQLDFFSAAYYPRNRSAARRYSFRGMSASRTLTVRHGSRIATGARLQPLVCDGAPALSAELNSHRGLV